MMARMHRTIQPTLAVHPRAFSDAERSAHARDCLVQHSGVWSVGGNFLPAANSPRTRWVGWRPGVKIGSRPGCPAVSATPNEVTVIRPISFAAWHLPSRSEAFRRWPVPAPSPSPLLTRTDDAAADTTPFGGTSQTPRGPVARPLAAPQGA